MAGPGKGMEWVPSQAGHQGLLAWTPHRILPGLLPSTQPLGQGRGGPVPYLVCLCASLSYCPAQAWSHCDSLNGLMTGDTDPLPLSASGGPGTPVQLGGSFILCPEVKCLGCPQLACGVLSSRHQTQFGDIGPAHTQAHILWGQALEVPLKTYLPVHLHISGLQMKGMLVTGFKVASSCLHCPYHEP